MADPPGRASGPVALIAGRYELVREVGIQDDLVVWEAFDPSLDRRVLVQLLRKELLDDRTSAERFWVAARSAAGSQTPPGEHILDAGIDAETNRSFLVREWPERPMSAATATLAERTGARLVNRLGQFRVKPRHTVLAGLIVLALLSVSPLRSLLNGWLAWINEPVGLVSRSSEPGLASTPPAVGAQQAAPTGSIAAVGSDPAAKPTAPAAPTKVATPAASPTAGTTQRIANTDAQGVALRDGPGGARLPGKGYDEGVTVQAFESTGEWTRIRGGDGREGWVLSVTLEP